MMQPIRKLANVNILFQNGIAASERVFSIFDNKELIKEDKNPIKIKNFNSEITFNKLEFKYNDNDRNVLNGINTK